MDEVIPENSKAIVTMTADQKPKDAIPEFLSLLNIVGGSAVATDYLHILVIILQLIFEQMTVKVYS